MAIVISQAMTPSVAEEIRTGLVCAQDSGSYPTPTALRRPLGQVTRHVPPNIRSNATTYSRHPLAEP